MTQLWTFEDIDYDLLRDDPSGADGISPRMLWRTKEEAKAAAEAEIMQQVRDGLLTLEHPIEWEEVVVDHRDGTMGLIWRDCDEVYELTEFRIFPMTLQPS